MKNNIKDEGIKSTILGIILVRINDNYIIIIISNTCIITTNIINKMKLKLKNKYDKNKVSEKD